MPTGDDPFQSWLDGFRKEVDEVIANSIPNRAPAAQQARTAFENWWQTSQEPLGSGAARPNAETERIESLSNETSQLRQQLTQAQADAASEREALSLSIAKLETRTAALQEQTRSLQENKNFLEEAFGRSESAKSALEEELKLERERAIMTAGELVSLKHKQADQESALSSLREGQASRDGKLEELRHQTSVYQERLVHAKELTDTDVALLRQEIKMFVEEFRIMINTIKRS